MYFIQMQIDPRAVKAECWDTAIALLNKFCIARNKFLELEFMGIKMTLSGRNVTEGLTGKDFVNAASHAEEFKVTTLPQSTNQEILVNLLQDCFKETYGLTAVDTVDLVNASFFCKNERFNFVLASAVLLSEVFGKAAVLEGNVTKEDIFLASKLLKETIGFSCDIPVLWNKENLWSRCMNLAKDDFMDAVFFFTALYHGENNDDVDDFLFSNVSETELMEIRNNILNGEIS